jgi:hypothetical protein
MRQETMDLRSFANIWIMLLVTAGLLLAPLAAPIMATPILDSSSAEAMSMSDDMSMTDDMPCCPDQTKSKSCDSCPFVALCMLGASLPAPSGAASLIERHPLRTAFAANNDVLIDGLGAKPPDHPPRTIV